jgi:hypothetical protein
MALTSTTKAYSSINFSSGVSTNLSYDVGSIDYNPDIGDQLQVFADNTELTSGFTINTSLKQILLNEITSNPPTNIVIKRIANKTTRQIDFQNASVLTEADLDNSALQTFHVAQEAIDKAEGALPLNTPGTEWDASISSSSAKITNVATPTADSDAATKSYADGGASGQAILANQTSIAKIGTGYDGTASTSGTNTNLTQINAVANNSVNINAVANDATDIGTVAGKATEIGKLGATAFADAPNGYLVKLGVDAFSNASNGYIKKVADIDSNVTTVAGIHANVTTVAGKSTEIDTIVNKYDGTTASSGTNKNLVQIDTVADAVANINTLATNISDINLVEDNITNVNAVAGSIAGSLTYAVTVPLSVFVLDGVNNPTITLTRGFTYTFDQSASNNSGHLLLFKDSADNAYTNGVTSSGTLGQAGAKTVFVVPANAPDSLKYYCSSHGNTMGNTITVVNNDLGAVASIGASNLNTVATNAESTAIVMGIALG